MSDEKSNRLLRVFDKFGFGDIGIEKEDFLKEDHVVEIGREPRKIQILTGIDGVTFEECRKGTVETEINGRRIKYIGKEDLIRNKAASGRAKDLIDVGELNKL